MEFILAFFDKFNQILNTEIGLVRDFKDKKRLLVSLEGLIATEHDVQDNTSTPNINTFSVEILR